MFQCSRSRAGGAQIAHGSRGDESLFGHDFTNGFLVPVQPVAGEPETFTQLAHLHKILLKLQSRIGHQAMNMTVLPLEGSTVDLPCPGILNGANDAVKTGSRISHSFPVTFAPSRIPPGRGIHPSGISFRVRLRGACVGNTVRNVDLEVPAGSIVGVGGLEGQGQRELSRALFGIEPFTAGTYEIDGKPVKINNPRAAVRHRIAFVPDDRKAEGLVLPLTVEENILSLVLGKVSNHGFMNRKKMNAEVEEGIRQLDIKVASPRQAVQYLSGGNQQKVVFSKWIKTEPRLLYLHEPTRGVDVQSKLEIYALIRQLTKEHNVSVVVFTSDILELIGLSDEIYVMYEGEISGHIAGSEATEEKIMQFSARGVRKTKEEGTVC